MSSPTLLVVFSALAGALVTYLGTHFSNLRREYATRVAAMKVVMSELELAHAAVKTTLSRRELWPAEYHLPSAGWESYRGDLVAHLNSESWSRLQQTATRLGTTEHWAAERRKADDPWNSDFQVNLETLANELDCGIRILAEATEGARRRFAIGRSVAAAAGVSLAAIALALLLQPGPALTSGSLADEIQEFSPGARRALCNKSTELEGAYTCTVDFPRCAIELQAAAKGGTCSPPKHTVYDVSAEGDCYSARLIETITGNSPPKPYGKLKRFLIRSGCIKG